MAGTEPASGGRLPPSARGSSGGTELTRLPLGYRLREAVNAYLPLLVMALLALATWWLVENAPRADADGPSTVARHVPDYTMSDFKIERFTKAGRLRVRIQGDELRHFPDTDTVEVDNPQIRAFAPDGKVTRATARLAKSNGDGSEVQLLGGAEVIREMAAASPPIEFRGEFLHAYFNSEELRSHLPVMIQRGSTQLRADSLDYKHDSQLLQLKGRVRATFPAVGERAPR